MISPMTSSVHIQSLHVYPLKSARGIDLAQSKIGPRGLLHDRHWMLIDAAGRFITQRTQPILATLTTAITTDGLTLSHPQVGEINITQPEPLGFGLPRRRVSIWRREHAALDAGDAAADYFSRLLGFEARLVSALEANFPDGYPLLVCNAASLADLNARLPAPLPMNRFRPNLVLQGLEPWDEDRIAELVIGSVRLRLVKPCTRCVITSLDQMTGSSDIDPLPVLRRFRYDAELKGVTFGENAELRNGNGAVLSVGAAVEVIWKRASGR